MTSLFLPEFTLTAWSFALHRNHSRIKILHAWLNFGVAIASQPIARCYGSGSFNSIVLGLEERRSESIAMEVLVKFAIAGFALYVIWTVARPRWHFRIVVTPDAVKFLNGVPDGKRRLYESFFLKELKATTKLRICGRREKNGRLITSIKGTDDDGLKQRIRNFLISAG